MASLYGETKTQLVRFCDLRAVQPCVTRGEQPDGNERKLQSQWKFKRNSH